MENSIVPRNLRFELRLVPRHWMGGLRSVTTFFDNLSIFFPAGERFFVAAVNAHRAAVGDEQLRKEVREFCEQEGYHSREHVRYNEMLQAQGYPVDELEGRVERLLARVRKRAPLRFQLAATCALEHLTALLAHMLLTDDRILDGAHPEMAALWRWHAAEESEHKSVAFDVYRAAGGHYFERVAVMVVATVIFWTKVAQFQVALMRTDGTSRSWKEWRSLAHWLFVSPGALRHVAWHYFAYYRPGFHPRQLDSSALLEKWRRSLDGAPAVADACN